jgi:hypothetical protein
MFTPYNRPLLGNRSARVVVFHPWRVTGD